METYQHEKPLSIALREINDGLLETSNVTVEGDRSLKPEVVLGVGGGIAA